MNSWRSVPTYSVAAMQELYQQMLPTKLYHQRKTGVGSGTSNVMCRMCGRLPENVPHVLAGCGTFPQTISILRGTMQLLKSCSCSFSSEGPDGILKTRPKPLFENGCVKALWDVPVCVDGIEVRATESTPE